TGYDLVLGSGTFIDTFEDQIVGHMPGETFDVNVTFPEEYGSADLAGKDALFVTTLNHINETVTPEFTDEWVAANLKESMGFSNVAEVNSFVESTLRFEQQANEIYAQLSENATFADEYPQILQEYYQNVYLYTPYQYSQMYGVSMEEMLTYSGYTDVDSYLTAVQPSIDASIRQQLLTQAVAEATGLVCNEAAAKENFQRYYGSADIDAYNENYGANYLRMTLLQDMSIQNLIDSATFE
ncbi:MAG: FKBP-type peptidyl-prolyl cis-trans isomerase, partial [Gemmiger sp.]